METPDVSVQEADFDVSQLQAQLLGDDGAAGALASFVGLVRSGSSGSIERMELEHYPGMTESSIQAIIDQARTRWELLSARVIHRVGSLQPGEQIVYVGVTSAHRGNAFAACEFIMDYLKTRAPFWKKEIMAAGAQWVEARESDNAAAQRWQKSPK